MTDIAIRVENLSKLYHIGKAQERHDTLRDALVSTFKRSNVQTMERSTEHWALRDVSFEVKQGEVVGIIGRNGAGKSTLLKILSRITEPTSGRVELHGRVASLLEVGTGFHPELTGRENIYLNGAILGMKRVEIDRQFDEIVAFAEIEKFLDTPVKRYSSGMYVRLAFAVAAHLEPEILLVDEVLAVGDAAFQKKCLGKMGDVAKEGRTVLFVSHNMGAVSSLCVRAILLESGFISKSGNTQEVITRYLAGTGQNTREVRFDSDMSKRMQIRRVAVKPTGPPTSSTFDVFDSVQIEIDYDVRGDIEGSNVSIQVSRNGEIAFTSFDVDLDRSLLDCRSRGQYRATVILPSPLKAGRYSLRVGAGIVNTGAIDYIENAVQFEVHELSFNPGFYSYSRPGVIAVKIPWKLQKLDRSTSG